MSGRGLIEIKNLAVGYGNCIVADSVNATLQGGGLTALVGRNGAGKSTLMRTMCGYMRPLSGEILYDGNRYSMLGATDLSKLIAVVLTDTLPTLNLTVRELVSLGRTPYTNFAGRLRERDRNMVETAMRLMNIESFADRRVASLSDGERQKCFIAKALAQETPVILLDEPSAFLDFPGRVELFRLMKRLAVEGGKAVLLSTHDIELATRFSDYLWFVDGGTVCSGMVAEVQRSAPFVEFSCGN